MAICDLFIFLCVVYAIFYSHSGGFLKGYENTWEIKTINWKFCLNFIKGDFVDVVPGQSEVNFLLKNMCEIYRRTFLIVIFGPSIVT